MPIQYGIVFNTTRKDRIYLLTNQKNKHDMASITYEDF